MEQRAHERLVVVVGHLPADDLGEVGGDHDIRVRAGRRRVGEPAMRHGPGITDEARPTSACAAGPAAQRRPSSVSFPRLSEPSASGANSSLWSVAIDSKRG